MVEDMLAARGIIVSHQTVRLWAEKFGRHFANDIRKRSAGRLGDRWYLDEIVITIQGRKHWLWRAVDQDGFVPGCPGAKPPQCHGCKTFDAKATERGKGCPSRHDHRQASIL
jgi:hypothetical protein